MQIINIPCLNYYLVEGGFVTGGPIGQNQQMTRCSSNSAVIIRRLGSDWLRQTHILIGPIRTFK